MSEKQITTKKSVQRKIWKHKKGPPNPVHRRAAKGNNFERSGI